MADTVTTQILVEGDTRLVMKFTNVSDGTGESAVTKVDVSALTPAATKVTVDRVWASTTGMSVNLLWDATTDVLIFAIPTDFIEEIDFCPFGGIPNNAGVGVTGDIQFTTVGHSAGDTYTIVLWMTKTPA